MIFLTKSEGKPQAMMASLEAISIICMLKYLSWED